VNHIDLLAKCVACFFFSSRRRHTRFSRDWSSDVCSSDLAGGNRHRPHRPDRQRTAGTGTRQLERLDRSTLVMRAPQNIMRGILLMLGAVFLFAAMDATAKWLSLKYPVPMLVWARYLVHCLLMLVFLLPSHGRRLWYSPRPGLQIVRALMLLGVTGFVMAAFRLLPLTVATAIIFLAPLMVGLLAGPLLKE